MRGEGGKVQPEPGSKAQVQPENRACRRKIAREIRLFSDEQRQNGARPEGIHAGEPFPDAGPVLYRLPRRVEFSFRRSSFIVKAGLRSRL